MKKYLLVFVFVLFGAMSYAQAPIKPGESQLNAGLGFSGNGLPIYVGVEFGAWDDISLGGVVSYRSDKETFTGGSYKYNYTSLAAVGNYHFNRLLNIPSNFDFYAGVSLGYTFVGSKIEGVSNTGTSVSTSGLYFSGQVGARYFFTDHFALNLELGGGNYISGANLGITYKF